MTGRSCRRLACTRRKERADNGGCCIDSAVHRETQQARHRCELTRLACRQIADLQLAVHEQRWQTLL